jgi:hypothetical protein
MGEGADGKSVACLPEYFMYYNYLKRLGTRQQLQEIPSNKDLLLKI